MVLIRCSSLTTAKIKEKCHKLKKSTVSSSSWASTEVMSYSLLDFCLLLFSEGLEVIQMQFAHLIAQQHNNRLYFFTKIMQRRSNILALVTVLLISMASAQNNTSNATANVTFAPPPPINQTTLFTFSDSPADGRAIVSSKLETLSIEHIGTLPAVVSNLTLKAFDRSATGNLKQFQISLNGTWSHVQSSPITLSCSVVYENNTKVLGLVRYNSDAETFRLLAVIPLQNLTQDNVTLDIIRQAIIVGEDCKVLSFTNLGINQTLIYRASADYTSINVVLTPSNWNIAAATLDLMYGISNNKLYSYNEDLGQYDELYTFAPSQRYWMKNSKGRILIAAFNTSVINNTDPNHPLLSINTTVIVLNHKSSGIVKVGEFKIDGAVDYRLPNIMGSPQLTKFGFGYTRTLGSLTIVAKHVDYTQNILVDLNWEDPNDYIQRVTNINSAMELDFNDYFLVVRNGSNFNVSDQNKRPLESAYQFTGTKVVFLRERSLIGNNTFNPATNTTGDPTADRQLLGFVKIAVDWTITSKLVVLDLYRTAPGSYQVVGWDYGSLASNKRVQKPVTPPFISFPEPIHDTVKALDGRLLWAYRKDNANVTNITVVQFDNATASHVNFTSFQRNGGWDIITENDRCKILREPTLGNFSITRFNTSINDYQEFADITPLVSNLSNINNSTIWGISRNCTQIRINDQIFFKPPQSPFIPVNGSVNFTWTEVDDELTTVVSGDGSLWRVDYLTGTFAPFLNPPRPFPAGAKIKTMQDRILLWAKNASSAWVFAFSAATNPPTNCLNYSFHDYQASPLIKFSPNLTKVLVLGPTIPPNATNPIKKADAYFINYPEKTFRNISFPVRTVADPAQTFIDVGQSFIYVRQLNSTPNATHPPQEFVIFLSQNTIPIQAFVNNLTFTTDVQWQRSLIYTNPNGQNFLFTQTLEGSSAPKNRVVTSTQINGEQASLNTQNNPSFIAEMENGKVKLCPPGCSDCDCKSCLTGYVLDSNSASCRPCPPGCLTCSSTDTSICESCITGSFLNATTKTCDPCSGGCISCGSSATQCSTCPPGQFFGATQCDGCPKNCFNCSDANTCITCKKGFTLITTGSNTGKCRSCSFSCSDCNPDNITECTGCAKGLQLINGKCEPCPDRCKECNNNFCAVCADGFTPNSAGVCVTKCQLPCLTCADNQPTYCLSCQSGSNVLNGQCQIDLTCNTDSSCTNCGQGLNYVLTPSSSGATCQACPSLYQCVQCDSVNNFLCSICKNGYYLGSTGSCANCSSNCTSCKSSTICTGCALGFTLMDGYSEGSCLQCAQPCATCSGSPTYCTSCVEGYTRKGWKCRNNTYIGFRFVLNDNPTNVMANIDTIVAGILTLLGQNTSDVSAITFQTISSGSTVMAGSATPTSGTAAAGTAALSSGLASGIPGTSYTVTGVSVATYGTSSSQEEEKKSNVGLIVGLVVGLTVLVAVVIVVIVVMKKKKMETVQPMQGDVVMVNQNPLSPKQGEGSDIPLGQPGTNELFELEKH